MALSLNTAHPLYPYLTALICVDDDGVVKDLTGNNTCTTHAAVVIGSGTYGRHFRTLIVSNNAEGIALAPGIVAKPLSNPQGSDFVVINAGNSRASRGDVFNQANTGTVGPGIYTGDCLGIGTGNSYPTYLGTVDVIGTGAHSLAVGYSAVSGAVGYNTAVDGVIGSSGTANIGNANNGYRDTYIGGADTGGYGGFAADYVWVAHFSIMLSAAQIADLHAGLGANNQFGLINTAAATPTTSIAATTANVIFSGGASVPARAGIALTTANTVFAGQASTGPASVSIAVTTANAIFSGAVSGDTASGVLTTEPLKNNTRTVLANLSGITVFVNDVYTGDLIVRFENESTDAAGRISVVDSLITFGDQHRVTVLLPSGAEGTARITAT